MTTNSAGIATAGKCKYRGGGLELDGICRGYAICHSNHANCPASQRPIQTTGATMANSTWAAISPATKCIWRSGVTYWQHSARLSYLICKDNRPTSSREPGLCRAKEDQHFPATKSKADPQTSDAPGFPRAPGFHLIAGVTKPPSIECGDVSCLTEVM
jgi:hypothetical protein